MKKIFKHLLSLIVVLSFLIIAFGSDNQKSNGTEISTKEPSFTVSANKLYSDYKSNGVSADVKYKGKVIKVIGVVNNIDRDLMDNIYVTLKGDKYFGDIQCFFSEDYVGKASKLYKGKRITVKGICDGKLMNVMLNDCVIE
jgi:hypothetical protein